MKGTRGGELILAIDQGTTGSTALLLDLDGRTVCRRNEEFPQYFPQPGWVEHEPEEIWRSVEKATAAVLGQVPGAQDRIAAIGITNQRETSLLWDADSAEPIGRAIVWQDRRTAGTCEELERAGHGGRVREVTGLLLDPYFSATKVGWRFRHDDALRRRAEAGQVQFGTVDSFLIKRLLGGARAPHVMEVTNASRTLLMDLRTRRFSPEMADLFGVPQAVLPRIIPSAGVVGVTSGVLGLPDGIPVGGVAGDQHAALFGQGCFNVGDAKCTYGTGAFLLVNTGAEPLPSGAGLLQTLAWQLGEDVTYALEGACFVSGAAVQWLRDGLGIIASAAELEPLARSVASSGGLVFVPALAGLGAPHWAPRATGMITGITRGTTKAHLARATLEAMALQVDDLLRVFDEELRRAGRSGVRRLRVDGGAAKNDLLLELQASLSSCVVDRPADIESTGRGAALLAAVGAGLMAGLEEVAGALEFERSFSASENPASPVAEAAARLRQGWEEALARVLLTATPG